MDGQSDERTAILEKLWAKCERLCPRMWASSHFRTAARMNGFSDERITEFVLQKKEQNI